MENFTPLQSLVGGLLIGTAALLLMALRGKIAGISGIVAGGLIGGAGSRGWRLAFLAGLIAALPVWTLLNGSAPQIELTSNWPLLAIAGLLVGFGTRLGGGCTSGHGVCGIGRLSVRSMVATGTFMVVAIITYAVVYHGIGG